MYLIQNIQVPMQSYYLKLLNMCKFAHDRKTLKVKQLKTKVYTFILIV